MGAGAGKDRTSRFAIGGDVRAGFYRRADLDLGQAFAQLGLVFHAGRYLLSDIAALAKIHAVQPLEPHFEDEAVRGKLCPGFRDHIGHPQRVPIRGVIGLRCVTIGAPAHAGIAGVAIGIVRCVL